MGMTRHSDRLGVFYNKKNEIERFVPTEKGIIHRMFMREPEQILSFCIGMNAGIYYLPMNDPNSQAIYADLKKSEKEQKEVRVYFKESPKNSEIFYVEFEK
jgi:hypothetical protein